jgi:ribosomal protein S18 acetylase RimI-like enzyme
MTDIIEVAAASVLDNPIWYSLMGAHRALALTDGRAARYPADVSPFMALPADATPAEWEQLGRLADGDPVLIMDAPDSAPSSWTLVRHLSIYQMVATDALMARVPRKDPTFAIETLGPSATDDMIELARTVQPGPFERRTARLGTFLGVRDKGKLIAMAGERMRPGGWTEVSAICTDPDHRGRGLARALTERLIDGIAERGERPFLHVVTENENALRLYSAMGFAIRRTAVNSTYQTA